MMFERQKVVSILEKAGLGATAPIARIAVDARVAVFAPVGLNDKLDKHLPTKIYNYKP